MREILFRGKVLRRSEWCQGFPILTDKCNVQFEVVGNIHDNPELMEARE